MATVKMVHFNTMCCEPILRESADGTFVMLCQCDGPREPSEENRVYVFRSTDRGKTWDNGNIWRKGKLLRPDDGRAVYQTEVYLHNGRLTSFVMLHNGNFLDWDCRLFHSDDNGVSWFDGGKNPWFDEFVFMRGAITLKNGHVAIAYHYFPISRDENEELKKLRHKKAWLLSSNAAYTGCGIVLSMDGGETFVRKPELRIEMKNGSERIWLWSEPALVQLSDNRLAMLMRKDGSGKLFLSFSEDEGMRWSEPKETDIPNPGNKPKLLKHSDGRIFLIHTPSLERDLRSPLQVWVSTDNMNTWETVDTLAAGAGYYSYSDGFIDEKANKLYISFENRHDLFFAEVDI